MCPLSEQFPTFKRAFAELPRLGRRLAVASFGITRKVIRKTWKPAITVFAILFLLHGAAIIITGRMLNARINALAAKGEPISLAELLAAPELPDELNAAFLYEKAFEALDSREYEEDRKLFAKLGNPVSHDEDPELWNKARLALDRYGDILSLAHTASSYPECRFSPDVRYAEVYFTHYRGLRELARLARAKALMDMHDDKKAEAVRSIQLILRISDVFSQEQFFISLLMKRSSVDMAAEPIKYMLGMGDICAEEAKVLYDTMAEVDFDSQFIPVLKAERAYALHYFDAVRSEEPSRAVGGG